MRHCSGWCAFCRSSLRRCGVQLHLLGFALTAAARLVRAVTSSSLFEMGRPASAGWQRALRGRRARVAQATDEFGVFVSLVYGFFEGLAGPLARWLFLLHVLLSLFLCKAKLLERSKLLERGKLESQLCGPPSRERERVV